MTLRIPLSSPDITDLEIDAVSAVLKTNTLSLGPKLEEFEAALAAYHHIPNAIAVSSGTAALHLAIRALNLGLGDEVIVPSFTFIAVANSVRYELANPVFADIDPLTLNISPASAKSLITRRTKAIIVVHTFGVPAEINELFNLARQHHLAIIEDACEAIGATYDGNPVGAFGDIATLAFYPNKQITTGEGGAVLTRDPTLAARIRALRNQGRYPSPDWLQHSELGYNYRLSEVACALGIVQLSRLPSILAMRASVAGTYNQMLSTCKHLQRPPLLLPSRTISWFVYVVRLVTTTGSGARDRILSRLHQQGIGCARYFAPIHQQPAYAAFPGAINSTLPVTNLVAERTLALPFFNRITDLQIEEVSRSLMQLLEQELT